VSLNDLLQCWADDAATRAIALCVGGVGNPDKFQRIAARVTAAKPILALASGDPDRDALFARAGVALAGTPRELLQRAAACAP